MNELEKPKAIPPSAQRATVLHEAIVYLAADSNAPVARALLLSPLDQPASPAATNRRGAESRRATSPGSASEPRQPPLVGLSAY